MKQRSNHMALPWLLVLTMGMTAGALAHAQYGAPAPPAVDFRYPPRWVSVPGTNVMVIRRDERPDYDMFNYAARYYIFDNGYWYRSNSWNGPFIAIEERSVPGPIHDVPQDEWRTYPSGWTPSANRYDDRGSYQDNGRSGASGAPAPPRIYFRTTPTWALVPGTSVRMIRRDQRPGYDMFDYDTTYYVYSNGYWYESDSPTGPFEAIGEGDVPMAIQRVPESEWRDYPSRWGENVDNRGTSERREPWRYDVSRAPAPPEIYFRRSPRWVAVPGTRVMVVRGHDRPRQDLFRLGGTYYLEVSGYWYRSNSPNGPYVTIDARRVPTELANVPRAYWRSYPEDWAMSARDRHRRTYR
jgi:YXWGXW repeat-containing protein